MAQPSPLQADLPSVLDRLAALRKDLPPTAKRIADFIIDNAAAVINMSVTEVADRTAAALAAGDFAEAAQLVELGRGFFTFHLANWLPALCDAVDEHAQTDFYHAVALMARGYVEEEAAFFNEVAALFGLPEQPQEVAAPSAVAVD